MSSRTRIEFQTEMDVWSIVSEWASRHGYTARKSSSIGRLYQKGIGFLVAPMMLSLEQHQGQQGEVMVLEAWVRMNLFIRAMSLFILPAEMAIESGGFRAVVPRAMARSMVNQLLGQLAQPQIP